MKKLKNYDFIISGSLMAAAIIVVGVLIFLMILIAFGRVEAFAYDITEPSELAPEAIEEILPEDMKGLGQAFSEAEQHGIDARFLIAVARLESGNGKSRVAQNKNNLFGWTCSTGYKVFETKEQGIDFVALKLREKYFDKGLTTIDTVAKRYCNAEWGELIEGIYGGMCNGS